MSRSSRALKDWRVPQLCVDCGRQMRPRGRTAVQMPGTITVGAGSRCTSCTGRYQRARRAEAVEARRRAALDARLAEPRFGGFPISVGHPQLEVVDDRAVLRWVLRCGRAELGEQKAEALRTIDAGLRARGLIRTGRVEHRVKHGQNAWAATVVRVKAALWRAAA